MHHLFLFSNYKNCCIQLSFPNIHYCFNSCIFNVIVLVMPGMNSIIFLQFFIILSAIQGQHNGLFRQFYQLVYQQCLNFSTSDFIYRSMYVGMYVYQFIIHCHIPQDPNQSWLEMQGYNNGCKINLQQIPVFLRFRCAFSPASLRLDPLRDQLKIDYPFVPQFPKLYDR